MSRFLMSLVRLAVVVAVAVVFCSVAVAAEQSSKPRIARASVDSMGLSWQPDISYQSAVLTVSGPGDLSLSREFEAGEALVFRVDDTKNQTALEDGQYAWELRFSPVTGAGVKEALRAARESGDTSEIEDLKKQGKLPTEPLVISGYFRVRGGSIIAADGAEASRQRGGEGAEPTGSTQVVDTDSGVSTKDQVILDDLIVDGSACVGMDCVNGESFGFDTIRIKENNLRIRAVDTSSTSSFPSRDWQITFNDSANGGANKFSIDDIDGGRTPFTLEAGAPSHSLYVDDGGRLGLGTSTPVADIHVKTGNTPTLRLEQDGSSGFTPQTWDVAGNEANFFIRDATNGSTLPFRIRPGAPTSAVDVAGDGDVGIGTDSPSASLHVRRTNGTAQLFVQEASGTEATRTLFNLENNGVGYMRLADTSADGSVWTFQAEGPSLRFNKGGTGAAEVILRSRDDASGNATLTVDGSVAATNVTFTSSRLAKTEFAIVDSLGVLEKVISLPISEWTFKNELNGRRHIGPMAEEFADTFDLGGSAKNISLIDASGVTLAAIQGLYALLEEKDATIEALTKRVAELALLEEKSATIEELMQRVAALEAQLSQH